MASSSPSLSTPGKLRSEGVGVASVGMGVDSGVFQGVRLRNRRDGSLFQRRRLAFQYPHSDERRTHRLAVIVQVQAIVTPGVSPGREVGRDCAISIKVHEDFSGAIVLCQLRRGGKPLQRVRTDTEFTQVSEGLRRDVEQTQVLRVAVFDERELGRVV